MKRMRVDSDITALCKLVSVFSVDIPQVARIVVVVAYWIDGESHHLATVDVCETLASPVPADSKSLWAPLGRRKRLDLRNALVSHAQPPAGSCALLNVRTVVAGSDQLGVTAGQEANEVEIPRSRSRGLSPADTPNRDMFVDPVSFDLHCRMALSLQLCGLVGPKTADMVQRSSGSKPEGTRGLAAALDRSIIEIGCLAQGTLIGGPGVLVQRAALSRRRAARLSGVPVGRAGRPRVMLGREVGGADTVRAQGEHGAGGVRRPALSWGTGRRVTTTRVCRVRREGAPVRRARYRPGQRRSTRGFRCAGWRGRPVGARAGTLRRAGRPLPPAGCCRPVGTGAGSPHTGPSARVGA